MKYFINVQGGTGLNIALASVLTQIKSKHDDAYFAVMSPYSDIFECCKAVDAVYKPNEARDFIFDAYKEDAKLVMNRLYDMDGFIKKRLNYESAWYELLGFDYDTDCKDGMNVTAAFDTSKFRQAENAANIWKQIKSKFKDFIIVQWTGGQSPLVQVPPTADNKPDWSKVPYNYDNEPLKRHYPIEKAQEFCDLFAKEHPETAIIAFQLPNEPTPNNDHIVRFTAPYLTYYELAKLPECKGVVAIDSSLQHLCAGVTKEVIIWGHSSLDETKDESQCLLPFGYNYNCNIIQKCRRNDILFFSMLGPSGARITYIEPKELLTKVDEWLYDKRKVNE